MSNDVQYYKQYTHFYIFKTKNFEEAYIPFSIDIY